MTIKSQAETIRDETVAGANTANRVGTCLVDIADALDTKADATAVAFGAVITASTAQARFINTRTIGGTI